MKDNFKTLIKLLSVSCKLVETETNPTRIKDTKSKFHRLLGLREDVKKSKEKLTELKSELLREQVKTKISLTLKKLLDEDVISKKYISNIVELIETEDSLSKLRDKEKSISDIYTTHRRTLR